MTYTMTFKKGIFKKKIKRVKGHLFPQDVPLGFMLIILDNEERILLNSNKYDEIFLSQEFYISIKKNAEEQAGQPLVIKDNL